MTEHNHVAPRCSMPWRRSAPGARRSWRRCRGLASPRRGRGCGRSRPRGSWALSRLLHGEPALHVLTRRGLRAAGRGELDPVVVGASNAAHLAAVARVAVALAGEGHRLAGERELRAWERAAGRALASAEVGWARDGSVALHRPDLVCCATGCRWRSRSS